MRSLVLAGVVVGFSATFVLSDEGIPPETLARIKGATAFVKVVAGDMAGSGSGFVIKVDGNSAYVVTNHHVIEPKVINRGGDAARFWSALGAAVWRPRFGLTPRIIVQTLKDAKATVVLYSGTPKEDVASPPKCWPPILNWIWRCSRSRLSRNCRSRSISATTPKLTETMPVYVFGFPFGEVLATGKGNPAITIGKGSDFQPAPGRPGELARVQIDGALNPGNSGGPVVDAHGKTGGRGRGHHPRTAAASG